MNEGTLQCKETSYFYRGLKYCTGVGGNRLSLRGGTSSSGETYIRSVYKLSKLSLPSTSVGTPSGGDECFADSCPACHIESYELLRIIKGAGGKRVIAADAVFATAFVGAILIAGRWGASCTVEAVGGGPGSLKPKWIDSSSRSCGGEIFDLQMDTELTGRMCRIVRNKMASATPEIR